MRKAPQLDGPGHEAFHQTPQGDLLLQEVEKWGFVLVRCMCFFFTQKKHRPLHTHLLKKRQRLQIIKSVSTVSELFSNNSPKSLSSLRGSWISLRSLSFGLGACHLRTLTSKELAWTAFFAKEKKGPWGWFPRLFSRGIILSSYMGIW